MQNPSVIVIGGYSPDTLLKLSTACLGVGRNIMATLEGLNDTLTDEMSLLPHHELKATLADLAGIYAEVEEVIPHLRITDRRSAATMRIGRLLQSLHTRLEKDLREVRSVVSICNNMGDNSGERGRMAEIVREIITESIGVLGGLGDSITHTLVAATPAVTMPSVLENESPPARQQSNVRRDIYNIRAAKLRPDQPDDDIIVRPSISPLVAGRNIASVSRGRLEDSDLFLPTTQDLDSPFIIESKAVDLSNTSLVDLKREVQNLKKMLSIIDPEEWGILRMRQIHFRETDQCFDLIYDLPPKCGRPRTLRNILLDEHNKRGSIHSLSDRFKLARRLANAVLKVHNAGMVHKNIRPDTIVICEDSDADKYNRYPRKLGTPYLAGFENARKDGPWSRRIGDGSWEKDIYLHPQRQGLCPSHTYSLLHDIYSLGVVLLEIAYWQSFVLQNARCNTDLLRIFPTSGGRLTAVEIRDQLVRKATMVVPRAMGDKFSAVVLSCLNCLDGAFGKLNELDEDINDDGDVIGILYIEKVVEALDQISL